MRSQQVVDMAAVDLLGPVPSVDHTNISELGMGLSHTSAGDVAS